MPQEYIDMPWTAGMLMAPLSNGWVSQHREVAARKLGRPLTDVEVVHHVDEDKRNNDPDNLWVFSTDADHRRYHRGGTLIDNGDGTFRATRARAVKDPRPCGCGKMMQGRSTVCIDCRPHAIAQRPTADELRELVWSMPTRDVAKRFGVSDVAVGKWCKALNVEKPPRGYWAKVAAAK